MERQTVNSQGFIGAQKYTLGSDQSFDEVKPKFQSSQFPIELRWCKIASAQASLHTRGKSKFSLEESNNILNLILSPKFFQIQSLELKKKKKKIEERCGWNKKKNTAIEENPRRSRYCRYQMWTLWLICWKD